MIMETSAPGSTEYRPARERDETGQIVVVDLGDPQLPERVSSLRKGEGKLINRIERIVDDLVEDGTLKSGAQTVVVVVHEVAPFPFSGFADDEDYNDE
jgi:hypothetical protein